MNDFAFSPPTAESIAAATQGLHQGVSDLATSIANLRLADGCGGFQSGTAIQKSLTQLGDVADKMSTRLAKVIEDYEKTVIAAGGLISQQEAENEREISKAGDSPGTTALGPLPGDLLRPRTIPNGPNTADMINSGLTRGLPPIPTVSGDAAGKFACTAAPESVGGITLDLCAANLSSADRAVLDRLAEQWKQLSADLNSSITTFHRIVQMKMKAGGWTGDSGPAVGAAAHKLVSTTAEISAQASVNGAVIAAWAGVLGGSKTGIEGLVNSRTAALGTTPPESQIAVQNQSDSLARQVISQSYNPGVAAIASGLSNLTDPSSPVTGVPLMIGGPSGSGSGGSGSGGSGTSGATSGGGGGGGGTGGGASTAPANKSATDAAKSLTRQGTGDPAAAAASNASKNAAAQSGQGNPASAAQSAMSKAGDTAKGLGGKSGASPLTRSAGLGSMADAEKSAGAKAASALGKGGGGAGGGGAGGGGGIGKMGGAGIAAAEGSLSARSAAGLSAAERAMAAPQAAPAAGRAGMGSGAPMGGARGGQGSENEKEHKSARYLISEENGEEIAGELPDTAPPVLGGLNLDTTDNPDTTR